MPKPCPRAPSRKCAKSCQCFQEELSSALIPQLLRHSRYLYPWLVWPERSDPSFRCKYTLWLCWALFLLLCFVLFYMYHWWIECNGPQWKQIPSCVILLTSPLIVWPVLLILVLIMYRINQSIPQSYDAHVSVSLDEILPCVWYTCRFVSVMSSAHLLKHFFVSV